MLSGHRGLGPGRVRPELEITTRIDGETVQKDDTGDLLPDRHWLTRSLNL
jgi:hypothetical protein